jgi:endo-beta-N-acetylglucosaminidase D
MCIYNIEVIFIVAYVYDPMRKNMSKPWLDLAEETLGPDDTVERTYSCNFNKQYGYLCLGRKKMVFVNVKGFLRKSYKVLLDAPYPEVDEVKLVSRYDFEITHNGETHQLQTSDISAKIVVEAIKEVIKSSTVKSQVSISGL